MGTSAYRVLACLVLLVVFPPPLQAFSAYSLMGQPWKGEVDSAVSFTFTGDIMMHQTQLDHAKSGKGKYDFASCFELVSPYLAQSDFCVGNLELPLGGKPYRGYPCFSAPDTLLYFLQRAGINVLTTANNHSCDRREAGVVRTVQQLESAGIPHTGTFVSSTARDSLSPLILQKHNMRIALLAYTYGTNGIKCAPPAIVNLMDTVIMARDIAIAKSKADALIVSVHWGVEYTHTPTREQRAVCAFLFRKGVNVVVGNHPHVIQPFAQRIDRDGNIRQIAAYALGNFISAQRTFPRAGGMLLHLALRKTPTGVVIEQPEYLLTYVESPKESPTGNFRVLPLESPQSLSAVPYYARRFSRRAERILAHGSTLIRDVFYTMESPLERIPYCPSDLGLRKMPIFAHVKRRD